MAGAAVWEGAKSYLLDKVKDPNTWVQVGEIVNDNKDKIKEYLPQSLGQSEHKDSLKRPIQNPEVSSSSDSKQAKMSHQIKSNDVMDTGVGSDVHSHTTPGQAVSAGGASSAGIGFRGTLSGNTTLHKGYAEHYHEIHELHSRKVKNYIYSWGFATADVNLFSPLNYTTAIPKIPGLAMFLTSNYTSQPSMMVLSRVNYGEYPKQVGLNTTVDIPSMVYTQAINVRIGDLLDNKLISGVPTSPGLMKNYNKFRLKHFEFEITPRTFWQSIPSMAPQAITTLGGNVLNPNTEWGSSLQGISSARHGHEIDMDYWVLRDVYNDFTEAANPLDIPLESNEMKTIGVADNYSRTIRSIRNYDTYLTIMNNKQPFKFRREIATKGNYFYSFDDIAALGATPTNVQFIVNALEGINSQVGGPNVLPESFNILFGPTQCPYFGSNEIRMRTAGAAGSYDNETIWANITTEIYVKVTATWEAFDFNYARQGGPTREIKTSVLNRKKLETDYLNYSELVMRLKEQRGSV